MWHRLGYHVTQAGGPCGTDWGAMWHRLGYHVAQVGVLCGNDTHFVVKTQLRVSIEEVDKSCQSLIYRDGSHSPTFDTI